MRLLLKARHQLSCLLICLVCAYLLTSVIGAADAPRLVDTPDAVPLRKVLGVFLGAYPMAQVGVGFFEEEFRHTTRVFTTLVASTIAILGASVAVMVLTAEVDLSATLRNMLVSAVLTLAAMPFLGSLAWLVPFTYTATCMLLVTSYGPWWTWPLADHAGTADIALWALLLILSLSAMAVALRRWPLTMAATSGRW